MEKNFFSFVKKMFFDGVCVVQKLTKKNHQPYVHLKCDCYCLYSSVIIVVMDTQTHTGFKWLNMLVWETNVVLTRKKNIYGWTRERKHDFNDDENCSLEYYLSEINFYWLIIMDDDEWKWQRKMNEWCDQIEFDKVKFFFLKNQNMNDWKKNKNYNYIIMIMIPPTNHCCFSKKNHFI